MTDTRTVKRPSDRDPVIELLQEFADCYGDFDVYKGAAKLRHLIGEELAEERRMEQCSALGF